MRHSFDLWSLYRLKNAEKAKSREHFSVILAMLDVTKQKE
jgi:hypothetical protein